MSPEQKLYAQTVHLLGGIYTQLKEMDEARTKEVLQSAVDAGESEGSGSEMARAILASLYPEDRDQ